MKHAEEKTRACEKCGASVYPEHIDSGIARYEGGRLLCAHCVSEYESEHDSAEGGMDEEAFEPISLEGHEEAEGSVAGLSSTKIHGMSAPTLGKGAGWDDLKFKRPLDPKNPNASRCRTFHCKLSEGAVDFLNNQVNEWLDGNPEITVKFANTSIGLFEGKHTEPNIVITIFY